MNTNIGTVSFNEAISTEQTINIVTLSTNSLIGSIILDGTNLTRNCTANIYMNLGATGSTSTKLEDYEYPFLNGTAVNILPDGLYSNTNVTIKVACDGLGTTTQNLFYRVFYDNTLDVENVNVVSITSSGRAAQAVMQAFTDVGASNAVSVSLSRLSISNPSGSAVILDSSNSGSYIVDISANAETGVGGILLQGDTLPGIKVKSVTDGISVMSGATGISISGTGLGNAIYAQGGGGGSAMYLDAGGGSSALYLNGNNGNYGMRIDAPVNGFATFITATNGSAAYITNASTTSPTININNTYGKGINIFSGLSAIYASSSANTVDLRSSGPWGSSVINVGAYFGNAVRMATDTNGGGFGIEVMGASGAVSLSTSETLNSKAVYIKGRDKAIYIENDTSEAVYIAGGTSGGGSAVTIAGRSSNPAVYIYNSSAGSAISVLGGSGTTAINVSGGGAAGRGIDITGSAFSDAIRITGQDTGAAIKLIGGSSASGLTISGGGTNDIYARELNFITVSSATTAVYTEINDRIASSHGLGVYDVLNSVSPSVVATFGANVTQWKNTNVNVLASDGNVVVDVSSISSSVVATFGSNVIQFAGNAVSISGAYPVVVASNASTLVTVTSISPTVLATFGANVSQWKGINVNALAADGNVIADVASISPSVLATFGANVTQWKSVNVLALTTASRVQADVISISPSVLYTPTVNLTTAAVSGITSSLNSDHGVGSWTTSIVQTNVNTLLTGVTVSSSITVSANLVQVAGTAVSHTGGVLYTQQQAVASVDVVSISGSPFAANALKGVLTGIANTLTLSQIVVSASGVPAVSINSDVVAVTISGAIGMSLRGAKDIDAKEIDRLTTLGLGYQPFL